MQRIQGGILGKRLVFREHRRTPSIRRWNDKGLGVHGGVVPRNPGRSGCLCVPAPWTQTLSQEGFLSPAPHSQSDSILLHIFRATAPEIFLSYAINLNYLPTRLIPLSPNIISYYFIILNKLYLPFLSSNHSIFFFFFFLLSSTAKTLESVVFTPSNSFPILP